MAIRQGGKACLALEDGSVFEGASCGAEGEAFGEICFNTSHTGYLEIITDPSYAGQIVTLTYPQIGNYGVCLDDAQANAPALRGLVVHDMCRYPSNWRSTMSLPSYCARQGIVAIEGIDTRALVHTIRESGAQRAIISTCDSNPASLLAKVQASPSLVGVNLAKTVSCPAPWDYAPATWDNESKVPTPRQACAPGAPTPRFNVVVLDCGVKRSILEGLAQAGCALHVMPWDTPAEHVLAAHPDGVFISNGPGDPLAVKQTFGNVAALLGKLPVFGICLGHQMMSLAAGAAMEKLLFGHHGGNQPVLNLTTGKIEITAQNHGFNLVFSSLGALIPSLSAGRTEHPESLMSWVQARTAPVVRNAAFGRIRLTHVNLNDGTTEGIEFLDIPAFSVQFHPEASPGPTDARHLFGRFTTLMDTWRSQHQSDASPAPQLAKEEAHA